MAQQNFADRLAAAIRDKRSAVCVGLDFVFDKLPDIIRENPALNDSANTETAMDAANEFCSRVLRVIAPHVAAVKINSAFFEKYYWDGLRTYYSLVQEAQALKLLVVGDVKRGDVGDSAAAYAEAVLADPAAENLDEGASPDAVTVNPLFGWDGVAPFLGVCSQQGKGVFVLVRTSNESAREFQDIRDAASGKPLWQIIGEHTAQWAEVDGVIGDTGWSSVGAVVAGTYPDEAKVLRELMPRSFFLVPGYGAQGASAEDCATAFRPDGSGALVSASRSIIYAYGTEKYAGRFDSWEKAVEAAAVDMKEDINRALAARAG